MKRIALLWVCFVFLACGQEPFFFLQFSDTQFGMYAKDQNFTQDQANLAFAIATANRLKPKFVIVCGDLVNKAGDAAQIAALKGEFARLNPDIPVYMVAGNHDVQNEPSPESLAVFREHFGRDHYSFDQGLMRGIVLNSSLIHSPGKALDEAAAQEKWLRSELERARTDKVKQVVIFQHHPYFSKSADEENGYFNIPLEQRRKYLDLFREYGVHYIFAGHLHKNSYASDGSLQMIATAPVGMPLGDARSGIRVVRVGEDKIEHRFYDFGALPVRFDAAEIRR